MSQPKMRPVRPLGRIACGSFLTLAATATPVTATAPDSIPNRMRRFQSHDSSCAILFQTAVRHTICCGCRGPEAFVCRFFARGFSEQRQLLADLRGRLELAHIQRVRSEEHTSE